MIIEEETVWKSSSQVGVQVPQKSGSIAWSSMQHASLERGIRQSFTTLVERVEALTLCSQIIISTGPLRFASVALCVVAGGQWCELPGDSVGQPMVAA